MAAVGIQSHRAALFPYRIQIQVLCDRGSGPKHRPVRGSTPSRKDLAGIRFRDLIDGNIPPFRLPGMGDCLHMGILIIVIDIIAAAIGIERDRIRR